MTQLIVRRFCFIFGKFYRKVSAYCALNFNCCVCAKLSLNSILLIFRKPDFFN